MKRIDAAEELKPGDLVYVGHKSKPIFVPDGGFLLCLCPYIPDKKNDCFGPLASFWDLDRQEEVRYAHSTLEIEDCVWLIEQSDK